MPYGNILTVYGADDMGVTLTKVRAILHPFQFENIEATFFVAIEFQNQAVLIRDKLITAQIAFSLYYIDDSTADGFDGNGIDGKINNIRTILSV
jgi:hypothetical protein